MKKLLWKSGKVSWKIHFLIAAVSALSVCGIEYFKSDFSLTNYQNKMIAAETMNEGLVQIKSERLNLKLPIIETLDPGLSGVLGAEKTPITTGGASLNMHLVTINPNWAAVIVDMLTEAGVTEGATVAAAMTGSFPTLNLAVYSAAKTLKLNLIPITSVSSSAWGGNLPELTWLDMESLFVRNGLLPYKSVAASPGGARDKAEGLSVQGRALVRDAIRRNGVPLLSAEPAAENIDRRMEIYRRAAGGAPIAAFVNVGTGYAAAGGRLGESLFKPGLNLKFSERFLKVDSTMTRFARAEIPVININHIMDLAQLYSLGINPVEIPAVGDGLEYFPEAYNKPLTAVLLVLVSALSLVLVRMEMGNRILPGSSGEKIQPPELMV